MERPALGGDSGRGEAMPAMKEPRQCIRCRRWFYDSRFYSEGRYGCRWHDCDRIDHVTRMADWRTQPKSWGETILGVMKMKKTNLIVAVALKPTLAYRD
jgi:hypothetical protein